MAVAPTDEPKEESFPWSLGVYDAHCHPTEYLSSVEKIPGMKTRALTIMGTRAQDQNMVAESAEKLGYRKETFGKLDSPGHLVPGFGWHPWFSHEIYDDISTTLGSTDLPPTKEAHYKNVISPSPDSEDFLATLPQPSSLSALLDQMRTRFEQYPLSLLGEVGLDSAFRIPGTELRYEDFKPNPSRTPGGRQGRRLSSHRVKMDHQRMIFTAQLKLAGELQRAVSVHGVSAHGVVYETLRETWRGYERTDISKRARKRQANAEAAHDKEEATDSSINIEMIHRPTALPFPPRICLHSFSGTIDTLKLYLHPSIPTIIFFSFSQLVNFSSISDKAVEVIKAVPNDRVLAESDCHVAGSEMDELMEEIIRKICEIKAWSLSDGVKQLAANWMHFISGDA